ncbi:MAG TPA: hypothetical protein VEZ44_11945 [bacterium]|nr:hypothetical protein [bacterium]
MRGVPWLLAWRSLADRPGRAALLLLGYAAGVGVMISLLSVGEALLAQARDPNLAAGGDLVMLPRGVDPAVLKVNGATALYFSIPHAAFVVRDLLSGPRFTSAVAAAAPEIQGRPLYVRVHGHTTLASASAGVPSLDQQVGIPQAVPGGTDSPSDRRWLDPTSDALYNALGRFHAPSAARPGWGEWDYVSFFDQGTRAYGDLKLHAGGNGTGVVLLRVRLPGQALEDIAIERPIRPGELSMTAAAQQVGPARVWVDAGTYRIIVRDRRLTADLRLVPVPGYYLPSVEHETAVVRSGYAVPVVRGTITGDLRTRNTTLHLHEALAYHDHNWGTWRAVTWDWGEASSPSGALVYGAMHLPGAEQAGSAVRPALVFLWARSRSGIGGFVGALEIRHLEYSGWHAGPVLHGQRTRIPTAGVVDAVAGPDRIRIRMRVWDTIVGPPWGAVWGVSTGDQFLQLRTDVDVAGVVDGQPFRWQGQGASEVFVPIPVAPGGR